MITIDLSYKSLRLWLNYRIINGVKMIGRKTNLRGLVTFKKESRTQIAIVSGDIKLTYETMLKETDKLRSFIELNSIPGQVVAVCGEPSPEMTICILAIISANRVVLLLDSKQSVLRQEKFYQIATPSFLLICDKDIPPSKTTNYSYFSIGHSSEMFHISNEYKPLCLEPSVSHIFFTSGTSGEPKGVIGTKENLRSFVTWEAKRFSIQSKDKFAQMTRPTFDVILQDIFVPLSRGASLVYLPRDDMYLGSQLFDFLRKSDITALHTVPSVMRNWLLENPEAVEIPTLRWLFSIGEPLDASLVESLRKVCKGKWDIVNLYGTTETGFETCWFIPGRPCPDTVPAGIPMDGAKVHILDPMLEPISNGQIGEIYLEHKASNIGYLRETESSSCFIKNPLNYKISKWIYCTGDKGFINLENQLVVLGRTDDEIKINGVRIQPSEIASFIRNLAGVTDAVVISKKSDSQTQLLAVYTTTRTDLDENRIRALLGEKFPVAFIPSVIRKIETIPLNSNGKADRTAILNYLTDMKNKALYSYHDGFFGLLAEFLGGTFDINRSFAEAGGTSLTAAIIAARAKARFGYNLMVHEVVSAPSLKLLADRVKLSSSNDIAEIEPLTIPETIMFPLCRSQLEYKLLCMRREGSWTNLPVYLGSFEEKTPEYIHAWVNELAANHDILRVRLSLDGKSQYFSTYCTAWIEWRFTDKTEKLTNQSIMPIINELGQRQLDLCHNPSGFLFIVHPAGIHAYFLGHHLFFDGTAILLMLRAAESINSKKIRPHIALRSPFAIFLNTDNKVPSEKWRKIDKNWWSNPFRIYQNKYTNIETISFKALLGQELSKKIMSISPENEVSGSNIIIVAFAKILSLFTKKTHVLLMQPNAGRTFTTSSLMANIYWNTYLSFDFNNIFDDKDAFLKMLQASNNSCYIENPALQILPDDLLLPLSSAIINFDSNSTSNALSNWTTSGYHSDASRGGLWEIQLSIGYGPEGLQTDWIYRSEHFSALEIEGLLDSLRQKLESYVIESAKRASLLNFPQMRA